MYSEFIALFGEPRPGRPRNEENPMGISTGDPAITETARRRAARVLRHRHTDEFEELMRVEAEYLLTNGADSP